MSCAQGRLVVCASSSTDCHSVCKTHGITDQLNVVALPSRAMIVHTLMSTVLLVLTYPAHVMLVCGDTGDTTTFIAIVAPGAVTVWSTQPTAFLGTILSVPAAISDSIVPPAPVLVSPPPLPIASDPPTVTFPVTRKFCEESNVAASVPLVYTFNGWLVSVPRHPC